MIASRRTSDEQVWPGRIRTARAAARRIVVNVLVPLLCSWVALNVSGQAVGQSFRQLTQTKDPQHVAVVGDAYLLAEDADGKSYLIGSCVLDEDENGGLCTRIGAKVLVLAPRIVVPFRSVRLLISPSGAVSVTERGSDDTSVSIGSLTVAVVRHRGGLKQVFPGISKCDDSVIPTIMNFGEASSTILLQGWIDSRIPIRSPTN